MAINRQGLDADGVRQVFDRQNAIVVDGVVVDVAEPNFWNRHPRLRSLISLVACTVGVGAGGTLAVAGGVDYVGNRLAGKVSSGVGARRADYLATRFTNQSSPTVADVNGRSLLVGVGDSAVANPGVLPIYRSSVGANGTSGCWDSARSTVNQVAQATGQAALNLGCTGYTIEQIEDHEIPKIPRDTRFILASAGANDLHMIADIEQCLPLTPSTDSTGAKHLVLNIRPQCAEVEAADVDNHMKVVAQKLVDMVELLKQQAPEAEIILKAYPMPLPTKFNLLCSGLSQHSLDVFWDVSKKFDALIESVAVATDVEFFNPNQLPAFSHNTTCTPQTNFVDLTPTTFLERYGQGLAHVNSAGAAAEARGIEQQFFFGKSAPTPARTVEAAAKAEPSAPSSLMR